MVDTPQKDYFDQSKREEAASWLGKKAPNLTCECCGQKSWTLGDLVMPMKFSGGGLMVGGATYPQIMIICNNCGNTKYFNAVLAGVVKNISSEDKNG